MKHVPQPARHSRNGRHPDYRQELDDVDPLALLIAPLLFLMLSIMVIHALVAASVT